MKFRQNSVQKMKFALREVKFDLREVKKSRFRKKDDVCRRPAKEICSEAEILTKSRQKTSER